MPRFKILFLITEKFIFCVFFIIEGFEIFVKSKMYFEKLSGVSHEQISKLNNLNQG